MTNRITLSFFAFINNLELYKLIVEIYVMTWILSSIV